MKYPVKLICLGMIGTLCLSSCSHLLKKQDGPPRYHVDVSRIPNATPKIEPRAKYGNMPSYEVFGKRYYTLRNALNYDKVGVASWYGSKFHLQKTSSGEPYNMLAMTAAHKTLPLPTYVEVTNLNNQRKVIVKVNDRGPFSGNRLIDLSYVAAQKLGIVGNGTAKVRVRALDPTKYYRQFMNLGTQLAERTKQSRQPSLSNQLYLQAGAFKSKDNALRLKKRLYPLVGANVSIQSPSQQSHFYRVRIGPLQSNQQANHVIGKLSLIGIKPSRIKEA